ncbi:DUF427 domain-containing protein [Salinisphaera sp. Q1T1-3]|uniref:DUF427 domain-containing protein n=1 Tax=Salinisphaera sp. Q1T1-3 TaxID=2321229 RepID=UPI000E76342E|nr:DUF427 domain-containing protein [Salinisphaera sp. Q1T1-3]RJS94098.1 DUF427 domain-containing protein [Salinisphaera sp. Q1T1-3]
MPETDRITTEPLAARVRVHWDDTLIADSTSAIRLAERGYPDRLYVPMDDVATDALCVSDTVTKCPYKGQATYYHVHVDGDRLDDAAWSYAKPIVDVESIAGHVAFDHEALTILCECD